MNTPHLSARVHEVFGSGSGSSFRSVLVLLLAVAMLVVVAVPADAAPRRVDAELEFDAVVDRVKVRKGECRVSVTILEGTVRTREGRSFLLESGSGTFLASCEDAVVRRGSTVSAVVRVPLQVQTTAGGNPEGFTARTRGVASWPVPIEVQTTMDGNPDGITTEMGGTPDGLKLNVATTASGNPEG